MKGGTLVIHHAMGAPRRHDDRWELEGAHGLYNEQRTAVSLHGVSPRHEQWEPLAPYQAEQDHRWWKTLRAAGGHCGPDAPEVEQFYRAVRDKGPTPTDVCDCVITSVIFPLSKQSVAKGSQPVTCPDFTRGKWETRKPDFALDT